MVFRAGSSLGCRKKKQQPENIGRGCGLCVLFLSDWILDGLSRSPLAGKNRMGERGIGILSKSALGWLVESWQREFCAGGAWRLAKHALGYIAASPEIHL